MTEELAPPGVEAEVKPPEVVTDTTPEVDAEAPEGEAKADDPAKAIERMQKRIDRKHAAAAKAIAENAVLKQQLEELRGKPKDDQKDVGQLAETIADAKLYAKAADLIVSKGKEKAKDFIPALQDLAAEVGEFVQPDGLPSKFMRAVLDISDSPHELLYHLGKNPDLAADLADLPVTKLAAKLDRIERDLKDQANPKSSSAPKPLEPVKAKASDIGLRSDLSTEEWMRRREREIKERRS